MASIRQAQNGLWFSLSQPKYFMSHTKSSNGTRRKDWWFLANAPKTPNSLSKLATLLHISYLLSVKSSITKTTWCPTFLFNFDFTPPISQERALSANKRGISSFPLNFKQGPRYNWLIPRNNLIAHCPKFPELNGYFFDVMNPPYPCDVLRILCAFCNWGGISNFSKFSKVMRFEQCLWQEVVAHRLSKFGRVENNFLAGMCGTWQFFEIWLFGQRSPKQLSSYLQLAVNYINIFAWEKHTIHEPALSTIHIFTDSF